MRALILGLAIWGLAAATAGKAATAEESANRTYYLIITGGELLEGSIVDAHIPFLTRTLLPLGLKCAGISVVDDVEEDIVAAYRLATNKSDLVLVTGGLGPTDNDITRQALSRCTGIELREQPELLRDMSRRFNTPENELRPNLRQQTQTPVRGGYLKNTLGTAAGLVFDDGKRHVIALPGPPRELQAMVREQLIPWLVQHYGIRSQVTTLTVRFLGLGQSQIDHVIKQKLKMPPGIIVGSTFEGGRVDFNFTLPEDSAAARQTLARFKEELLAVLGDNIYSTSKDTLEDTVLRGLAARKQRLAVLEIASGGSVMAALARSPLAGGALAQGWSALTEAELFRGLQVGEEQRKKAADLSERLKLAATTAARLSGAECVLVVGPAEGTGGSSALRAALLLPGGRWVEQNMAYRAGPEAQAGLVTQIMGFLWKKLPETGGGS